MGKGPMLLATSENIRREEEVRCEKVVERWMGRELCSWAPVLKISVIPASRNFWAVSASSVLGAECGFCGILVGGE